MKLTSKAELAVNGNSGSHIEVAMMLDTTGSMSGSKMSDLKTAAKDLVDIVVWADQSQYTSRVALAPFSEYVNVSATYCKAVAGPNGCTHTTTTEEEVEVQVPVEREVCTKTKGNNGHGNDDDGNDSSNPGASNNGDGTDQDGRPGRGNRTCTTETVMETRTETRTVTTTIDLTTFGDKFTCIKERATSSRYLDTAPGTGNYYGWFGDGSSSSSRNSSDASAIKNGTACKPGSTIVPLSSDKAILKSSIDAMPTTGTTAGHLGTTWAWNMVSPNWKDVWPSESEPKPYSMTTELNERGKPKLYKIAVLMTDGSYNRQYSGDSATSQARQICTEMKRAGVTVYTVGFRISTNSSPDVTMQQCATSADHYYNAATGDALKQAFRDIALKIAELRISE